MIRMFAATLFVFLGTAHAAAPSVRAGQRETTLTGANEWRRRASSPRGNRSHAPTDRASSRRSAPPSPCQALPCMTARVRGSKAASLAKCWAAFFEWA